MQFTATSALSLSFPAPNSHARRPRENRQPNIMIERGVKSLLAASGCRALRNIDCTAEGSVLSLHGCVHAYHHKEIAQEIARRVNGVRQIENYIRVLD